MLKQLLVSTTFLLLTQTAFSQGHYFKGNLASGVQKKPDYFFSKDDKTTVSDADVYLLSYFYQLGYVKEKANNKSLEFLIGGRPGIWQPQYDGEIAATQVGRSRTGNVHFQLEQKRGKCFDEKRKSTAYFGTFYNLSCDYHDFRSTENTFYSSKARNVKARMGIVPGTQIVRGKRLVIDLNIAVSLISFGVENRRVENPMLSESAQKSSTLTMEIPMEAVLRVGIAYRI